ncbi:MAG: D-alanine--D-alanine ligase [Candidatus Margulisbacteria bacterium]|nr:D-alanine--D-alanine ligase [Candidatus Margulisiibacteriota bacterium]MBU1021311.1 D-alanine--D-alanine ligase [Candidatus Margulisiibacteriota bacterium]MBU1729200.1 D-alanine--D-alanine ligase [Candidatus Margulisiibacteriota bacterium]MBU1954873.1 D-alanine--D-alanine ligase [Candidatus Margulisiibacteriota bacterium]
MSDLIKDLKSKKIAVLMGGRSGERDVSLRSGTKVFESLKGQGFDVVGIDVDGDLPEMLKKNKVEIAYIVLHGKYGEDGTVQGMLETIKIPYTGSGVLASALAMDKVSAKRVLLASNIPTPKFYVIDPENITADIDKIKKIFPFPLVIKPHTEGSSLGVSIVKDMNVVDKIIRSTVKKFRDVFVEEYIPGKEVTVGIIGCGKKTRALPILELLPKKEFYDYEAKYTPGMTDFILPARLPKILYEETQKVALAAHKILGCRGVSRVDIQVGKDHVPYVIDINTIPGMTDQSDLPAEAAHAGISFDELVVEILESALL